jgi:hypothetical protein
VTREEMELLGNLKRICAEAPAFALGFPDNGLPVVNELEFGCRLVDIAQRILQHARQRGLDNDNGGPTPRRRQIPAQFVIDGTGGPTPPKA